MRFGPVPTIQAEGAILAHSLNIGAKLRKGRRLRAEDVSALLAAGVTEVVVARLDAGDLSEDAAAAAVARALRPDNDMGTGLSVSAPFTGRVNIFAGAAGIFRVNRGAVDALNAVDPAITLATLADWTRVRPRQMVATVKIIPYGVASCAVEEAVAVLCAPPLAFFPFSGGMASLILTRTEGLKESLIAKGAEVVGARLRALGFGQEEPRIVAHDVAALAAEIARSRGDIVLILGGSATSDAGDVAPRALITAGGELTRFGMPVDPGNLLFLGRQDGRPVVGLPGCARSPAINGADWVLERLAAGLDVSGADIAAMGVGGLLKEIPLRPQPRAGQSSAAEGRPYVSALVLAAGAGRRMRGGDKLLEQIEGRPILRRVAAAACESHADEVLVVLPPDAPDRRAALEGLDVGVLEAREHAEGMAASLRAGLAAVAARAGAVVILLADMPEVGPAQIDRLIAAFDPAEGREICRAVTESGLPGHPVLFGRRFFETLDGLTGDRGARDLLRDAEEFVTDVPTPGEGAAIDLDTPEDWTAWRARTRPAIS